MVSGGLKTSVGPPARGQHVSTALARKETVVQLLQVYATRFEQVMVMQLLGLQLGPGRTVTVKELVAVFPQGS